MKAYGSRDAPQDRVAGANGPKVATYEGVVWAFGLKFGPSGGLPAAPTQKYTPNNSNLYLNLNYLMYE